MSIQITGTLAKMRSSLSEGTVQYRLPVGDEEISLNPLIGKTLTLSHTGNIFCCSCGKKTKKSYSQGHCFVCMKKLASCDMCIMKPETAISLKGRVVNLNGVKRIALLITMFIFQIHRV